MPPLSIPPNFKKVANKKPAQLRKAIYACVAQLGKNPRHQSLRTHPVRGAPGVFEAYVDMANRVTFHWEGPTIVLRNNCNHSIIDRGKV